jgi:hypothetical protein
VSAKDQRIAIINSLDDSQAQRVLSILNAFIGFRDALLDSSLRRGVPPIETLKSCLKNSDINTDILEIYLNDPDGEICIEAIKSSVANNISVPDHVKKKCMNHSDYRARMAAYEAWGKG